jgi:hypothetical protein
MVILSPYAGGKPVISSLPRHCEMSVEGQHGLLELVGLEVIGPTTLDADKVDG